MTELVQCTRCHKTMINEEYDQHRCSPQIQELKSLKFTSYSISENYGKKTINIRGSDGTHYQFLEIPEDKEYTKIPYISGSTDLRQGEKSTSNKPK